jgi:sugar phosphate permease
MNPLSLEQRVVPKVMWRLVPFMMLLYLFNYLDRVNINVAKLQMNLDLNFTDEIYGTGVAVFFIGYFIFEVPSNMIMERVGARIWIARIMISWGLISCLFMFVEGKWSFYALRFLLGITEAGFFPGMLLYLTYWIPARQRAHIGAIFMTSIALAGVIGSPLSGWIMDSTRGVAGLKGWQWLFVLEGIPTVLLGCSVYFYMTDKPEQAEWLSPEERNWLSAHLNAERARTHAEHGRHRLVDALKSGRVWVLCLIYSTLMLGFYPINYWTATIIKEVMPKDAGSVSDTVIGLLTAIPFLGAIIGMVIIGRIADKLNQRRKTVAICAFIGSIGLLGVSQSHTLIPTLICLTVGAIGVWSALGPFWTLPPAFLSGSAVAAGLAFINSWGNLAGGFAGNQLMGYLKETYKTYSYGLMVDSAALIFGMVLTLCIRLRTEEPGVSESVEIVEPEIP